RTRHAGGAQDLPDRPRPDPRDAARMGGPVVGSGRRLGQPDPARRRPARHAGGAEGGHEPDPALDEVDRRPGWRDRRRAAARTDLPARPRLVRGLAGSPPRGPQAVRASAPATTSRISCVISAWRARFIASVRLSISSPAFFDALRIAVI